MKNIRFLFATLIPLHIIFFLLIFSLDFSAIDLVYLLFGYVLIGGLGVEVGLHRWAAHKSVEVKNWIKPFLIFFSIVSCQGHPVWWAAVHRGTHHRFSDTVNDEHSPFKGTCHAFLGWIIRHDPKTVNYKFSADLLKDKLMFKTINYYEAIILVSWLVAGYISLNFLLFFFIIPTIISFHGVGLINAACHSKFGRRNFETSDNSKNIPVLGYFLWGNGWHNNHHHKASSYDFGKSISGKKWEFDPCTILLPIIKK
jgi:fatty-acid desaturase